ncbi:MAG: hypothetical protein JWQ74_162 [Marmoricola sp.]|nr:hypothetical protein [Marmoricola sp.]
MNTRLVAIVLVAALVLAGAATVLSVLIGS